MAMEGLSDIEDNLLKRLQESGLILFVAIAVFLFVSLISYDSYDSAWSQINEQKNPNNYAGVAGAWVADVTLYMLGVVGYMLPSLVAFAGYKIFYGNIEHSSGYLWILRIFGTISSIVCCSALCSIHFPASINLVPNSTGGMIGEMIANPLLEVFSYIGSTLILSSIFCTTLTIGTGFSWYEFISGIVYIISKIYKLTLSDSKMIMKKIKEKKQSLGMKKKELKAEEVDLKIAAEVAEDVEAIILGEDVKKKTLPSIECLEKPSKKNVNSSEKELTEWSMILESKLNDFKIEGNVVAVHPGPVITSFEVELSPGTKASSVTSIDNDLARSLSVSKVRVVNVIPGKSVIGIEIPNEKRTSIRLKSIIESSTYQLSQSPLTLALGVNTIGQPVIADLSQMPHLLIAGTTGAGKSVGINSLLLSILYKSDVDSVKFVLIDPKMLELSVYSGIPHLLSPVITDGKDAIYALNWCIDEMERRYKVMSAIGVRNLTSFNHKIETAKKSGDKILDPLQDVSQQDNPKYLEKMPYIVVVIDELADLLLITNKKIECQITRLAQKARASGIHMILATQRPSVDVLTGLIKANVPARIAYQVASKIDSRTILDQQGAENLLGKGDMLYLPSGSGIPIRVHGPFVSDDEIEKVVTELKQEEPKYEIFNDDSESKTDFTIELDELFYKASEFARNTKKISISSLQRYLRVGYNRSARLIEQLEHQEIISGRKLDGYREYIGNNNTCNIE